MNLRSLILISFLGMSITTMAFPVPFKRDMALEKAIVANYADMAYANYSDSLVGAKFLGKTLSAFTALSQMNTAPETLKTSFELAKITWTNSRLPYGQSEIFRFYNGPIDFEAIDDGVTTYLESINFEGVEGLLNAWPLDEAYIDYVGGDLTAGIINDPSIAITRETLELMNERDGEKNISTGYHAIEFLLWGQDQSLTGPGQRPVSDYTTAKNADRRRLYLNTLSETMISHLEKVTDQWKPGMKNYREELVNRDPREVVTFMFTAMIAMAGDELKSERIENALLLEDQEEEQSCFSDTTINDIYTNYLGVKNTYLGKYKGLYNRQEIKGASVSDLVASINPALDKKIREAFTSAEETIAPFYGVDAQNLGLGGNQIVIAFDVAITSQQSKVQMIVDALDELDGLLKQAASELGLVL